MPLSKILLMCRSLLLQPCCSVVMPLPLPPQPLTSGTTSSGEGRGPPLYRFLQSLK